MSRLPIVVSLFLVCTHLTGCGSGKKNGGSNAERLTIRGDSRSPDIETSLSAKTQLTVKWQNPPAYYGEAICSTAELTLKDKISDERLKVKSVRFEPFMKAMSHGTLPVSSSIADNKILISSIYFSMPGRWELEIDVTLESGEIIKAEVIYDDVPSLDKNRGVPCE